MLCAAALRIVLYRGMGGVIIDRVFVGKREDDCVWLARQMGFCDEDVQSGEKGFVDGLGHFYDLESAKDEARSCGQIPLSHKGALSSDDLW
mgnify:CR=1 FL=1